MTTAIYGDLARSSRIWEIRIHVRKQECNENERRRESLKTDVMTEGYIQ